LRPGLQGLRIILLGLGNVNQHKHFWRACLQQKPRSKRFKADQTRFFHSLHDGTHDRDPITFWQIVQPPLVPGPQELRDATAFADQPARIRKKPAESRHLFENARPKS
jgi:hypothetical protein